jgi:hypothetical protein
MALRLGTFSTIDSLSSRLQSINISSSFGVWWSRSSKNLSIYFKKPVTLMGLLERSIALRFFKDYSEGSDVSLLPWKETSERNLNLARMAIIWVRSLIFLQVEERILELHVDLLRLRLGVVQFNQFVHSVSYYNSRFVLRYIKTYEASLRLACTLHCSSDIVYADHLIILNTWKR